MTDVKRGAADLACLVDLTDPPPQPADTYGAWKGGWVDFDGATCGSAPRTATRADSRPGRARRCPPTGRCPSATTGAEPTSAR